MAYDKIDNLFLFTHPSIQQRTEEVQGGLRWIMTSVNADVDNNGNDFTLSQSMEREGIVIRYDISKKHREGNHYNCSGVSNRQDVIVPIKCTCLDCKKTGRVV